MTPTNSSSSSYKLWSLISMIYRHRVLNSNSKSRSCNGDYWSSKLGYGRDMNQGLRFFGAGVGSLQKFESDKVKDEESCYVQPQVPAGPTYNFFIWMKWLMGSILLSVSPFWKQKWESLPGLGGKVVKAVEEVEDVVEVVENVAAMTEKASEKVADIFPEKCRIKQAALTVEHVSNVIVQDAEQTKHFIHKVDDLKQDIKALETIVEPVIEKIMEMEHAKSQSPQSCQTS